MSGTIFYIIYPKYGNNRRYLAYICIIYGGVLSLFVKFSRRSKKTSSFNFTHLFVKKNRKIWKIEKLREKNVEKMAGKNSPIRVPQKCNNHAT